MFHRTDIAMHFTPARVVAAAKKPSVLAPPIWKKAPQIEARDRQLAAQCDISPVVATILRAREYSTPEAIECFLRPTADCLHDPFTLPDIEAAVARLQTALDNREPILIFGDYDVDGVTSTALLVRALRALKADVSWEIPERHDGYGLSTPAIEAAAANGIKLIFSVDCGIGAFEPAARARELGVDLIITDHHEPVHDAENNSGGRDKLPDAVAVINPKRADSRYGFRELSGCGVAFKVLQALLQKRAPQHLASFQERYVDLVGLAAIADCVPLVDENRYLTRMGLQALARTGKLGMQALIQSAGIKIKNETLSGRNVGFMLAPRLNAAGRIASAQSALQLLLSTDENECNELATTLDELNRERQEWTRRVTQEAVSRVYETTDLAREMILVVAGENWPHGVVGLVASKLSERFCRPAIVIGIEENGMARGSGRSFADFDLTGVIARTEHLLESGGGHTAACGLTLKAENIEAFQAAAVEYAAGVLQPGQLAPTIQADCEISGEDLTRDLIDDLALLEPCGMDNPEATLLLRNAQIVDGRSLKDGRHVKWRVRAGRQTFDALWWSPGDKADGFAAGQTVDLCVSPELNEWNGIEKIQLVIKAARQTKTR
jgi:single-stranded-DNA-specific exonuclease